MAKEMIHLSDGVKAVCGAEDGRAVKDPQNVTCLKCQAVIDIAAQKKGDPIVRARIFHQDLKLGQDFNFTYEGVGYHGISGEIHRLPRSIAEHLKSLAYPVKEYREGQESGQSMVITGKYHRFIVEIIEVIEPEIPPDHTFKKGDSVLAFDDGQSYPGKVAKVLPGSECEIEFDDGDTGCFETKELTLT